MRILAIESSCDETAAAVVENGTNVLSNIINTQIEIHKKYGGVVPEIASRKHIENISDVVDKALTDAGLTFDDIDALAVTYGPGLVGALLVGVSEAKAVAYATMEGIALVAGLQKKPQPTLYRVQVGAFEKKAYAEAMLEQLEKAGFTGYIN